MTATARRLQSTPMAPYMDVMRSLDVNDMHLVVEFMNETIREAEEAKRRADVEFLAKKMAVDRTDITSREAFDDWSYSLLPQRKPILDEDRFVRFKNIKRVKTDELCYRKLCDHEVHYTMQNDREMGDEIVEYIERFFK